MNKIKKIAANLNYSDIVFPLDINDYEKIEDRFQMQVNVFGYGNKVYPLYISNLIIKRLIYYKSLKKANHTMYLLKILTD